MPWVTDSNAALLTDLYELTMAASYHRHGMNGQATFDLFVRDLPRRRNFMVAAGLDQALDYLLSLRFDDESLDYLASLGFFSDDFLGYLAGFRFSGDVWAIPEGDLVFETEPLISVTAPLIEAQVVETFLLNCLTFQTMIASKAARVKLASGERTFLDFSLRRDHGADAGLKAARAAYIAGAAATSNVLAGKEFGIPVSGTMAHSYVMAFDTEIEAFRAYVSDFPERAILLIDTFDVEQGARRAVQVAEEIAIEGLKLNGVRIDSGDFDALSRSVRKILDDAGLHDVKIVLSGDLDEYRIKQLLDDQVPVDSFGVGTQMGTSADSPYLGGVYKLVWDAETGPKVKLSTGKVTLPGRKQVHRFMRDGKYERDVMSLNKEEVDESTPILQKFMMQGERIIGPEGLDAKRDRFLESMTRLPDYAKVLGEPEKRYPVELSPDLESLAARARATHR
ncbi:MAG: nicotinate phosphoribosyltransferase [Actinomycetota bacterium]|jgi:nicotinate phosphoribosyltransferase|nr:nicotinate phosphoribosyltransferase [Actinomycetota bacterium]